MKIARCYLVFLCFIFVSTNPAYSLTPSPSQTGGGIQKQEEQLRAAERLEKQITKEKTKPEEPVAEEKPGQPAEEGQKILIHKIEVRGVSLIPQALVDGIVKDYEGKEAGVRDMQKICDLITDEYRKRGRVTSRAYLPPQNIKGGTLVVTVLEGRVGSVDVRNNKYFTTAYLKKKLHVISGDYLDYQALQKTLVKINEHPDRTVKLGLVPGKEPGTTDLILDVHDRLPIHASYEYDNFGSRYTAYDRHGFSAEDNNLFGVDDKFAVKYQRGPDQFYDSTNLSYSLPVTDTLDLDMYWLWSNSKLGKEFAALDVKSKTQIGGVSFTYGVIDMNALEFKVSGGFDYKHSTNLMGGAMTSRDNDRVVKIGGDLDLTDAWGRTVITLEEDVGILGFGLRKEDPFATRPDAGPQFQKLTGYLYRLQPMPFSSSILWKNQFQASNDNLLSVEQFQLGGVSNVRGYETGEYGGDQGIASTVEWSFPPYFIPKDMKAPFSKSTLYDAVRLVGFYDVGYTEINNPLPTDQKNRTLQGWGYGIRGNLPEDFSARFEVAYPIHPKLHSDDAAKFYVDIAKKF
ncbi:MAG: ShlB/FhaC/HecB family hemolysin secretion/activation protein [Deltaproteobacteria bacterium]|nr:ShlB/FhaC/HecB family hemolysin secretion/activation protein [Deltaproteobacteria bacterium]